MAVTDAPETDGTPETRDAFDADLLARITGTRQAVGGHRPFLIEDPGKIWLILRGHIDVYAFEMAGPSPVSTGRHLFRVSAGEVLFGIESLKLRRGAPGDRLALRAVAAMGTELYEGSAADVQGEDFDIVVVDWIDRWVGHLTRAMAGSGVSGTARILEAEPDQDFKKGTYLCAQIEDTVWARVEEGRAEFLGDDRFVLEAGGVPVPLTETSWIHVTEDSRLGAVYTPTLLFQGGLWDALAAFHAALLPTIRADMRAIEDAEREQGQIRLAESASHFHGALQELGSVLTPEMEMLKIGRAHDRESALFQTFRLVAERIGVEAKAPLIRLDRKGVDPLAEFARASGTRMREVVLEPDWYLKDNGPLIGYWGTDKKTQVPVAFLPGPDPERPRYEMVDVASGARRPVTAALNGELGLSAYMLYRPFPRTELSVTDVLRFGLKGLGWDLRVILACGIIAGLMGMITPIFTGYLFSDVVPRADFDTHLAIILALVASAFGVFVFEVTRGFALLRVQGRMDGSVQSAVWDRLLALPLSFFRQYTAGDLADRANSINAIREILTGATMQTVFSAIFSLFSFALLFYYSWELALVATALVGVVVLATTLFTWLMLPHKQKAIEEMGKVEGLVFQFLAGISKLRSASGETRAFARWAKIYRKTKHHTIKAAQLNAGQETFNALFPVAASIVIYAYVYYTLNDPTNDEPPFSIGAFLSFNAALGQFNASILALTASVSQIIEIVPLYKRADPILKAVPEIKENATDPGELHGHIEISNLTFRYLPDTPPVLDNLSLTIRPGEFVAFVGASGSGKSTVLRMLLGFEEPEAGGVYYDGQDLSGLDVASVRRQIGVVLQGSQLTSGTVFTNIVGNSRFTINDAWVAAKQAGLDEDIRAMPMGMHTAISENASTLSGGQKQRLMIARALVMRPRILILDEATSALDNHTQAIVNASLETQNLTRIVVAHRLTTIVNAHRIIVLKDGRIAESGRYSDLMARDGEFAAMARRQLL